MGQVATRRIEVPTIPGPLDHLERWMADHGALRRRLGKQIEEYPVVHRFTPGLYIRELSMPMGTIATTMIHKTEHPLVVSKGRCHVYLEGVGWREFCAPHIELTKPGTRRCFIVLEDTVWTTFHPTHLTDIGEIEEALYAEYENPLLEDGA